MAITDLAWKLETSLCRCRTLCNSCRRHQTSARIKAAIFALAFIGLLAHVLLSVIMMLSLSSSWEAESSLRLSRVLQQAPVRQVGGGGGGWDCPSAPPPGASRGGEEGCLPISDYDAYKRLSELGFNYGEDIRALNERGWAELARNLRTTQSNAAAVCRAFVRYGQFVRRYQESEYSVLIDPGACGAGLAGDDVLLVVHSLPDASERRRRMRQQLRPLFRRTVRTTSYDRAYTGIGYRLLFLVGACERCGAGGVSPELSAEARQYGDTIVADFREDYYNLTLKTLTMLRWVRRRCPAVRLLVKLDDDVSVNLTNLRHFASAPPLPARRTLYGLVHTAVAPVRNVSSRFHMPLYVYAENAYPPFARGGAYALTGDAIGELVRIATAADYVHLEDVAMGMWFGRLRGARVVAVPRFLAYHCTGEGTHKAIAFHKVQC